MRTLRCAFDSRLRSRSGRFQSAGRRFTLLLFHLFPFVCSSTALFFLLRRKAAPHRTIVPFVTMTRQAGIRAFVSSPGESSPGQLAYPVSTERPVICLRGIFLFPCLLEDDLLCSDGVFAVRLTSAGLPSDLGLRDQPAADHEDQQASSRHARLRLTIRMKSVCRPILCISYIEDFFRD